MPKNVHFDIFVDDSDSYVTAVFYEPTEGYMAVGNAESDPDDPAERAIGYATAMSRLFRRLSDDYARDAGRLQVLAEDQPENTALDQEPRGALDDWVNQMIEDLDIDVDFKILSLEDMLNGRGSEIDRHPHS